jgi:predicted P-loop ATPase
MTDVISLLLTSPSCRAAKRWSGAPPTCEPYDCGALFDVHEHPVADLAALAALLGSLRSEPRVLAVRGTLLPGHRSTAVRRRSRGDNAPFEDRPHHWLLLDLDSWEDPDFLTDPAESAARARERLHPALRTAACIWHASGSAGFKTGARLHLWFWLDRPLGSLELKRWVQTWGVRVDNSLFSPVQPHYTADPVLVGLADPLPLRFGTLPGTPEVATPRNLALTDQAREAAQATLRSALARLRKAAEGDRNNSLFRQASRCAAFSEILGDGGRDQLAQAAIDLGLAPNEAVATVESAWRDAKPHALLDSNSFLSGLSLDDQMRPRPTVPNLVKILEANVDTNGLFCRDERTSFILLTRTPPWHPVTSGVYPAHIRNEDASYFQGWLSDELGMHSTTRQACQEAIEWVASLSLRDPFRDYLDEVEWDGSPRLSTWLPEATGCVSEFARIAGRRWLISAVARTYRPGCKVDTMLVLIGEQGMRKSTLLKELVGETYFTELQTHLDSDEAYMQTMGPAVVELPELSALGSREIEAVKAHLSTGVDRRRAKYARWVSDHHRRFVYAGTTNDPDFLHDTTGNRRFWPVYVTKMIDTDRIRQLRDQLWAEAVHAFRAGEQWHLTDRETSLAEQAQDGARARSGVEELLAEHLDSVQTPLAGYLPEQLDSEGRLLWVNPTQLARALDLDLARQSRQIASAFRALGWVRTRRREPGGPGVRRFERPPQ